jgi:hypothetical protein
VGVKEKAAAHTAFRQWYDSLKRYGKFPAKGPVGGALVVLDRLQQKFDLSIDSHTARGGSQISGASGTAVKVILEGFNETRPFLHEGGRTNRGLRGDIKRLLEAVKSAHLETLSKAQRDEILRQLQEFLVARVHDYHHLQRLEIIYDPSKSTWQSICDLLDAARAQGKDGPVAQYLVGAKLQLRFPTLEISNESFSTADAQLGRHGDFYVGSTIFHVTVSPTPTLYQKCKRNLRDGFKVYLLVRNKDVVGTKQNAENTAPGQIVVESIEAFIGQNLDELAVFSEEGKAIELRRLFETYNRRVDAIEINKALMVEIPPNLPSSLTE